MMLVLIETAAHMGYHFMVMQHLHIWVIWAFSSINYIVSIINIMQGDTESDGNVSTCLLTSISFAFAYTEQCISNMWHTESIDL